MNKRNLIRIMIGALLLVSGLIGAVFEPAGFIFSTMLITAGCAFLAVGILRFHQYCDSAESDERSEKIAAYGFSYAWQTGVLFITVLYWLDVMGIFRMGTQGALGLILMVLAISAVLYQMYLFRRGDVA